jgi:hypothetical protein
MTTTDARRAAALQLRHGFVQTHGEGRQHGAAMSRRSA